MISDRWTVLQHVLQPPRNRKRKRNVADTKEDVEYSADEEQVGFRTSFFKNDRFFSIIVSQINGHSDCFFSK